MSALPPGFVLDQPARPSAPMATPLPTSPQRAREEARQDRTEGRQAGKDARDAAADERRLRLSNPQALRKEFSSLPEVQSYSVAAQQLAQALNTGEGPQADLALTYSFAKAMDPNSVVRESEQGMVTGSQPYAQSQIENLRKQLGADGAGSFTPETRAQLRQQIIRSVASRRQLYDQARQRFSENAQRNGIDPTEITGPHVGDAYVEQARDYDRRRRAAGATLAPGGVAPQRQQGGRGQGWWDAPRKQGNVIRYDAQGNRVQ
jgi:hypothetical protein